MCAAPAGSFSINKDPDWIGGFFPFFLRSLLPGPELAFGGAAVQKPGGEGPEPCAGRCSGAGWRERAARSPGSEWMLLQD